MSPVFLKLTRRRAYAGAAPIQPSAEAPTVEGYPSPALKRILERIERSEDFCVLDLGVLAGESITTFAQAGARVHVHDLVSVLGRSEGAGQRDVDGLVAAVRVPPGSVDLVCAWGLFDLLTPDEAARLMAKIGHWLVPKGWVLSVFGVEEVVRTHRFRASREGLVTPVPRGEVSPPKRAATNSQVVALFSGYQLLNSALMRGRFREVLAQRR